MDSGGGCHGEAGDQDVGEDGNAGDAVADCGAQQKDIVSAEDHDEESE